MERGLDKCDSRPTNTSSCQPMNQMVLFFFQKHHFKWGEGVTNADFFKTEKKYESIIMNYYYSFLN
jgi:hypothetical protein